MMTWPASATSEMSAAWYACRACTVCDVIESVASSNTITCTTMCHCKPHVREEIYIHVHTLAYICSLSCVRPQRVQGCDKSSTHRIMRRMQAVHRVTCSATRT